MGAQQSNLNISENDIRKMVTHPDEHVRASMAQKVCRQIRRVDLTENEREAVSEILSFIIRDAASMVRRALAVTLKKSNNLPREIARKLIRDVDSIASPVLTFSPVLTDDDLLEVLKSKAASKILAVSKRERIKGDLVKAIIRFGDSRAIASLAANDGAELGVHMGSQLLDIYHDDDLVKESFIARRDLPSPLVEKLITMVSAEVAVRLHEKHGVSVEVATQLANQSRELASIEFMSHSVNAMDLKMWIEQMDEQGRLTNSFIVRAACNGQIPAVVHAFARKTQINTNKASLMVHDSGPFGLKALCVQSGLSDRDFRILRAALLIHADLEIRSGQSTRERFQKTMLERILSLPIAFADDDLVYLFNQLDLIDEY